MPPSECSRTPASRMPASSNVSYVGPKSGTPFRARNVTSNIGFCPTIGSRPTNRSTSAAMVAKCGAVASCSASMPVSIEMRYSSRRSGLTKDWYVSITPSASKRMAATSMISSTSGSSPVVSRSSET